MIEHCYYETNKHYPQWGGRGIRFCERWRGKLGYEHFLQDMGMRPREGYSLDRINNDGNYEPSNCRWATAKQQMNNRRQNYWVVWNGGHYTLGQLLRARGMLSQYRTIHKRIHDRGWTTEEAIATPIDNTRKTQHGPNGLNRRHLESAA